jgi:E3 ubiquitin-protein ligase HECTD1
VVRKIALVSKKIFQDGKTPLDKARERNDEGHREVASILQSPADWIAPSIPIAEDRPGSSSDPTAEDEDLEGPKSDSEDTQTPKGDPEMIPVYVKILLKMFCQTYQSTMIQSVKRSSLGLIKKIIHYLNGQLLTEKCLENSHLVSDIVEVMTSVLDNEEDEDGHLSCLLITQDLLTKDSEGLFLEQFAKLGLFSKVICHLEAI